jgi:DNA-binding transcriptional LysR family regulator
VENGLGIACIPEFSVHDALVAGTLEVVLSAFTEPRHTTFRIFWPSSRHPSPKVRALVDFLVGQLAVETGGP